MSNFVVAVGGSGAKMMQTQIHLSAAGLLPENRPALSALLVDPDENNGNVEECQQLFESYVQCRTLLAHQLGNTPLLRAEVSLDGPYTPVRDRSVDTLKDIFRYHDLERKGSVDAELLDLFFEPSELEMSIKQGFRGRPAIGATVLAQSVTFDDGPWSALIDEIRSRGTSGQVHLLLTGSVFGGSGAAGVPTLVRLLSKELADQLAKLRVGLALFLPFFQFRPVEGEEMQADPAAFPIATAEALKYYHERGFLGFCDAIYVVGEQVPADVPVAAVGAARQRNEPHFVELIAGMGAMHFFNGNDGGMPHVLAVAARNQEHTVTWSDLPYDEHLGAALVAKLQTMCRFAVAYRYLFWPLIVKALDSGRSDAAFWVDQIQRQKTIDRDQLGRGLRAMNDYVERYLVWLMRVSTPRREGFTPGLVNPHVFAVRDQNEWRLKAGREFNDGDFDKLVLNQSSRAKLDSRLVFELASRPVADTQATGAGRLVRALYDACRVE